MPTNPGPWSETEPSLRFSSRSHVWWYRYGTLQGSVFYTTAPYGFERTRSGYRLPDYWERVARHERLPVTSSSLTKMVTRVGAPVMAYQKLVAKDPANYTYHAEGNFQILDMSSLVAGNPQNLKGTCYSLSDISRARTLAHKKLRASIRDTPFQALPFVGELGESVRMIASTGTRLNDMIISRYSAAVMKKQRWYRVFSTRASRIRRGDYRTAREIVREFSPKIADYWLEGVFGWMPLVNDLDSFAKACAEYVEQDIIRTRPRGKAVVNVNTTKGGFVSIGSVGVDYTIERTDKIVSKFGADWSKTWMNRAYLGDALHRFGVDWMSITPGVWELVPYSFLIDYFTNIGDCVEALTVPYDRIDNHFMVEVFETDVTVRYNASKTYSSATLVTTPLGEGTSFGRMVKYSRGPTALGDWSPDVGLRLPSTKQVVNTAALWIGRLGRVRSVVVPFAF